MKVKVSRSPQRGFYDKETIYSILDASFVCQVGFVVDGMPVIIPMSYGRDGNSILLHGASTARITGMLSKGNQVCVSVTLIDGLVVARTLFDTSVNYRSVVLFAEPVILEDHDDRMNALKVISDHILPGRWDEVRPVAANEMKATAILRLEIDHASAKIRSGPPDDDVRELDTPVWAGVIPLRLIAQPAIADPALRFDIPVPGSVSRTIQKYS